ncbi:MAG TPA: MFS transporter, partial [Candidatus Nanoarchaeia archaeon]|nr:MFS transporter [Candidatus Nanoarchaeia archaeon]
MDKRLLTIGLVMFTEVLGWSLILPFLPYYAEEFGATPFTVGLILSSFSMCQFFSAPVIGKLSDRFGRKPMFIVSQLATMAGFVILGFANSLWMIVLSRVVDGLFGSNMTLIHAYLGDISKGKNRAKFMGYFGAFFCMGMFIGPAIGGFLAAIDYSIPSFIAAGMTVISMVLIFVFLEETVKRDGRIVIRRADFFPFKPLLDSFKNVNLRRLFTEFFLFIIAFTTITSSLALFVKHQLGFGPEDVGMALLMV